MPPRRTARRSSVSRLPDPTRRPGSEDALRLLTERPGPGPHHSALRRGSVDIDTLADLPPARNGLLFVGLRPSATSVAAGHYHQGDDGHRLWGWLVRAGVLPNGTRPETADDALVAMGHGITDLAKDPGADRDSDADLLAGVGPLWQKIALWRPGAIVFVDRRAAEISAGRPLLEPWGVLADVALAGRPCVLLPAATASRESIDEGINLLRNLLVALPR